MDIHEHWGIIEADFQREYHIDLEESIHTMSWRRFLILLKGLSQNSVLVNLMHANKKQKEDIVEDEAKIVASVEKIGW